MIIWMQQCGVGGELKTFLLAHRWGDVRKLRRWFPKCNNKVCDCLLKLLQSVKSVNFLIKMYA